MALRGTAWNSYSQMSLGLGMIFDGLQCSQHLLGEYRRNHVLISVHSNSSSICLIVQPLHGCSTKKKITCRSWVTDRIGNNGVTSTSCQQLIVSPLHFKGYLPARISSNYFESHQTHHGHWISTPSACLMKRDYHSIPLPQNLGWKISPVK